MLGAANRIPSPMAGYFAGLVVSLEAKGANLSGKPVNSLSSLRNFTAVLTAHSAHP